MYKIYNYIFLFFLALCTESYSFRLDNIVFNERMDGIEGGYRESYLINNSFEKQRYKINILKGEKRDGSRFIQVSPKIITVNPKSKGVIKIFAKAPSDLDKGEYDFKLQFKPINIPTLSKAKSGKITGVSNISVAPIVPMKGYVGQVNFADAIQFRNIQVTKNVSGQGIVVTGDLSNSSFASIDFGAEAYGSNNFFYQSVFVANLAPNTKKKKIRLFFTNVKNPKDLKKIVFYRTPSNKRIIIKEILLP